MNYACNNGLCILSIFQQFWLCCLLFFLFFFICLSRKILLCFLTACVIWVQFHQTESWHRVKENIKQERLVVSNIAISRLGGKKQVNSNWSEREISLYQAFLFSFVTFSSCTLPFCLFAAYLLFSLLSPFLSFLSSFFLLPLSSTMPLTITKSSVCVSHHRPAFLLINFQLSVLCNTVKKKIKIKLCMGARHSYNVA